MEPLAILSLVLFAALLVAFVAFLRRAGALVAAMREHERFQRDVADLERRAAASIDPLIARIDDVRHRRAHAEPVLEQLPTVRSVLADLVRETAAIRTVPAHPDVSAALGDAYTKAERALGLVEHGVGGLVATRGGPRELEAQTSLKRGALALRNARGDAAAIARAVGESRPPGQRPAMRQGAGGSLQPSSTGARSVVPPPPASLGRARDESSDPSM